MKHRCVGCGQRTAEVEEVVRPSIFQPGEVYRSVEKWCKACGHRSTVGEASGGRLIEAMNDRAKEQAM